MRWLHWILFLALTIGITGLFLSQYSKASVTSNFQQTILPLPQCSDLVDNDDDGLTDYPDDPECDSLLDNSEGEDQGGGSSGPDTTYTPLVPSSVVFSGTVFPNARISIQTGGNEIATGNSSLNSTFRIRINEIDPGIYPISLVATDINGRIAKITSQMVEIDENVTLAINDLVFPPTVAISRNAFTPGDIVQVTGYAPAQSNLRFEVLDLSLSNPSPINQGEWLTDASGWFEYEMDTTTWDSNDYMARVKLLALSGVEVLSESYMLRYAGDASLPNDIRSADTNGDGRIDLIDLSKMIFWYQKDSPPAEFDLNDDGIVDLVDISILIHYWTG